MSVFFDPVGLRRRRRRRAHPTFRLVPSGEWPAVSGSFSVVINGLTGGIAEIGTHASITYTETPTSATETVKWSDSANPLDAATYGTGASPTDFTAGDGGNLFCHVTDGAETVTVSAPIQYAAAVNTVAPVVSGSTGLGDVLSTTNGTWTGAVGGSYSYQWQRGGVDIAGETGTTYTIVLADDAAQIRCVVTYTNSGGAPSANSNAVTVNDFDVPANTVAPAVTGNTGLGDVLTTDNGTWTADPTISGYTYQWRRNGSPIGGETASTYTIVLADDAATITCEVTATNAVGSTPAVSNGVAVDDFAVPVITGVPTISGTEQEGNTLTATPASVAGNPTPTRTWQWRRTGAPIAGATSSTYLLQQADVGETIDVIQTETNALGVDSATSAATGTIAAGQSAPVITGVPTISGTELEGEVLTATPASVTGNPTPTRTWQWKRGGTPIGGATASTYTLVAADVGNTLTVEQTETNVVDSDVAESVPTGTIGDVPANTVAPAASGNTSLGDTLSVTDGTWTATPAITGYTYQWRRNTTPIGGATANTYVIVLADDNATIDCEVTATNPNGSTAALSNGVAVNDFTVPVITGVPTISGTEVEGQALSASAASVSGEPPPNTTWQWKRGGTPIAGATSFSYVLVAADVGNTLTVEQTETNALGSDVAESAATGVIAAASGSITINSSAFNAGAGGNPPSVDLNVTESGTTAPLTAYWATIVNPSTPTKAQLKAGTGGGIVEAGSFVVTPPTDQDTITGLTNDTPNEIHLYIEDASGTPIESAIEVITGVVLDTTVPTFSSGNPADNATDVAIGANLVATFSENVFASTGEFYLYRGVTLVETFDTDAGTGDGGGTISVSGTDVTINPGANMQNSAAHNVEWSAGAVKDASGNPVAVNASDTLWNFTTVASDVTAPVLTNPVDNANGQTAATGSVDTDEGNGTLYAVVTTSATSPSAAQVKAGQDHTSTAAAWSGSQAVSATGTQTLSPAPSGLTASTAYWIHYMHEDAATNQSNVSSADGFTTAAASLGDNFNRANENLDVSADWTVFNTFGGGSGFQVVSNQIEFSGSTNAFRFVRFEPTLSGNDQYCELDITQAVNSQEIMLFLRITDASNWYRCHINPNGAGTIIMKKNVGGTESQLGSGVGLGTPGLPYKFRFEVQGTTLRGYVGGTERISRTDTSHASGSNGGIGLAKFSTTNNTDFRADNYLTGTL